MPRLIEHFSKTFSLGLELDERIAKGTQPASAQEVYETLRKVIDRAAAQAAANGKRAEHIQSATFAVVAWLDEVIAKVPGYWGAATPLQVALYNTNNAGNEFFFQLAALKNTEDEVREVYYHVLLCGFVGQYYFESGDNGELGKLKDLHSRQLPIPPAAIHTLREERITPQPYQGKDPPGPRFPRQWDQLLLKVGVAVALLIPFVYLLWFLLASPQDRGPTLAEQVNQHLQGYACSDLSASVSDNGAAAVKGFVSKPDDIARIHGDISAIPGVRTTSFDIGVRIWPHCEVVALLQPYIARNADQQFGLQLSPNAGHSSAFVEDERIIVSLQQPKYDGYLYVDYYTVDGSVIHLYPNKREPGSGRLLRAGEQFNVGEKIAQGWIVGSPFGQEFISVIAAPKPLYTADPPEFEEASAYLPRLRAMLDAQHADDKLVATDLFLQTQSKK
jgi:type IV/VI secretion system ImpK/VasF family protein